MLQRLRCDIRGLQQLNEDLRQNLKAQQVSYAENGREADETGSQPGLSNRVLERTYASSITTSP